MLEVKVLELILVRCAPETYNPLLLPEKVLEVTVNVPPSEYKPVEEPSALLLLYLKKLPTKVLLALVNFAP